MSRWNVLLFAALIASSLYVVHTAYESRRLFAALDRARDEQAQLDIDFKRLQADSQEQATNLRVEKLARDKLAMRSATPSITHYVDDPIARAAAAPPSMGPAASSGGAVIAKSGGGE